MAARSEMDLEDNLDSSTSSQISKSKESSSALGNKRVLYTPFKLFFRDFLIREGRNPERNSSKKLLKKALKAWRQMEPRKKLLYQIMMRVQIAKERKVRELALKKNPKDKPMQDGIESIEKRKLKRKVILVVPSLRSMRPRMVARRPTPLPSPQKREKNRSKRLPKYVPYRQKKQAPLLKL
ncbi:uncharacterized protein LOC108042649 [Drosophila rhopaloa]|uniref:Uncharacterized protein LOC108042649 n=1 Tax=Drosophila rhopaloa TaxID=1041015 RepID=A0A6P4EIY0_DRORH|nr:uncharacterized protein LOC108042649 [Drosophila rhopaloa]